MSLPRILISTSGGGGSGGGNAFGIIQPPSGTSPTASSATDTLNLTSSDSSLTITGNSGTKTVDFKVKYSSASLSGTAIDCSTSNVFYKTIGGSTTFTFTNFSEGQTVIVRIYNTSTPLSNIWTGVLWAAGINPTIAGDSVDVYTFVKINGSIYGSYIQAFA